MFMIEINAKWVEVSNLLEYRAKKGLLIISLAKDHNILIGSLEEIFTC